MGNVADVIVVGLGAVGSAALYQAARSALMSSALTASPRRTTMGSSHGDTRITREAIGEGRELFPWCSAPTRSGGAGGSSAAAC